jgi:hypothetical protein
MSGDGYCKPCILGCIVAEFRKTPVQGWLPTAKSDTEAAVPIELVEPTGYTSGV